MLLGSMTLLIWYGFHLGIKPRRMVMVELVGSLMSEYVKTRNDVKLYYVRSV